ncbi:GH1 family beta-glucosidase [Muricauda sp. SCSIO 64092]|uniref:GH1 family beta-glucosidase n=1 Tax=Allomuricauda sp. SCSIO 64092 TaxID=2908842 RepID=UPI001FF5F45E|nr:GH1 family beta-glucosidase [Muricauda sp. SCSIO 64092]UOY08573.1 GH1 family beta-glucosidase [Muricauda sp. SCSIO 64092]
MKHFPNDFLWGTATSSYQIEGAANLDGKGPSIWDAFASIPGKIKNNETGNLACDHYHRFEEDVQLMKNMGVKAYRFSISWSRVLPTGKGAVNEKGIQFYSKLIDSLLRAGIEPWVTLYHWDLPLALQLEDDGWLGSTLPDHFANYAKICFDRFGDRVKSWITLNEPWVAAMLGYGQGVFAPGRTSNTEPYRAAHQLILAHAKAVTIYRKEYGHQNGKIGITNNADWREPLTLNQKDLEAAERALEFFLAWFADPIFKGDYPQVMRERLGSRLPKFTDQEKELIKGTSDFFGLNHYTTMYAAHHNGRLKESSVYGNGGISEDQDVTLLQDSNWPVTSMNWAVVPWGCRKLLRWINDRYDQPDIYITENGCSYPDVLVDGKVDDTLRVAFYKGYLEACQQTIAEGIPLKGYFAWSFMDNFEWASGYEKRFGLHYVDFETLERIPKKSALWYKEVISKNGI